MNVYRRVLQNGKIEMLPNYAAEADTRLTVLAFRRADSSLKASVVHYPCHANLSDTNTVKPDYPGMAMRMLDEANPGSVSLFMQGCTADLRPNSVLGSRFTAVGYNKAARFAADFYASCAETLASPAKPVGDFTGSCRFAVRLPLENTQTLSQLEEHRARAKGVELEWAEKVLEKGNPAYEELELSLIRYGEALSIFTLSGEVSQSYAAEARRILPDALCASCANGMTGYIADSGQIAQGGYEPVGSALYFALAGTFEPGIEQTIRAAMQNAANQNQKGVRQCSKEA
jgi:hypothetical protein